MCVVSSMEPEFYEAIKTYINAGGLEEDMEVVCSTQPAIHNLIKLVSEDCHRLHKWVLNHCLIKRALHFYKNKSCNLNQLIVNIRSDNDSDFWIQQYY